jgi:hypothetical protein
MVHFFRQQRYLGHETEGSVEIGKPESLLNRIAAIRRGPGGQALERRCGADMSRTWH